MSIDSIGIIREEELKKMELRGLEFKNIKDMCTTGDGPEFQRRIADEYTDLIRKMDIHHGMDTTQAPMNGIAHIDEILDVQKRFDETLDPLMQEDLDIPEYGLPVPLPFWGNDPIGKEFEIANEEYSANVTILLEDVEIKNQNCEPLNIIGLKGAPAIAEFRRIVYFDPETGTTKERMELLDPIKPPAEYLGPPVEVCQEPPPDHPLSYDPETKKVEGLDNWHEDPHPILIKPEITEPYQERIRIDKLTIKDLIDFGFMSEIFQIFSPSMFNIDEADQFDTYLTKSI